MTAIRRGATAEYCPRRWTAHRKMELVVALQSGRLDRHAAADRYGVAAEELEAWTSAFNTHGLDGLKVIKGLLLQRGRREAGASSARRRAVADVAGCAGSGGPG